MTPLSSEETAALLPYPELVAAIAHAAQELASGAVNAPERLAVPMGAANTLLCMPAVAPDLTAIKIVTVHTNNAAHSLPAIQGEVIVLDTATGRRLMLLDGPTVTARRTAAVTLLAIKTLSPREPRSALIIGTGAQAATHADALINYFGMRSLWIAGEELPLAQTFCDKLRSAHAGIDAVPVKASTLAPTGADTDVVIALTTAKAPVIPPQLPDATLAIGVGAFRPDMAELPAALLGKRRIVVDYLKGARHEAGDLLQAGVDWTTVTELSAHLGPDVSSRDHTPTAFKSVGHASWDLAAARVALQRCGRR
ncbi:delta(1)-pyrroline-2-carboxylate reductase family protein [Peristeroidobacter agariperforans]|uniref:delta(1)-pyrroline-2-carboxylate reductase family protein n=1 Tax=Peristeroidobacter agariperforans TaxID=268404 RepID=UPI00101D49E8|nr:delta(1)-pyrroline-2-carboxylate reductase family protein [Peristeroidobacter agariperforans]